MAKKSKRSGPNKSKLIREYMKSNPDKGPQAVADALKADHNVVVTPQFVSTIKSNDKRKGTSSGSGIRMANRRGAATPNGSVSSEALFAAKKFIHQLGGVEKARAAVAMMAQLLD